MVSLFHKFEGLKVITPADYNQFWFAMYRNLSKGIPNSKMIKLTLSMEQFPFEFRTNVNTFLGHTVICKVLSCFLIS